MGTEAIVPLPGSSVDHDQDARLEAIYLEHAVRLRGQLLALTRDPSTADDLASEAFLRLATQIRSGRTPDDPGAWLYRVGRNLLITRARRATVATRAMPAIVDRGVAASPEDALLERERDGLVREALETLEADDRAIVMLAASGYQPAEIAGLTGRSSQATRTRLCRARGRIRAQLLASGFAMS